MRKPVVAGIVAVAGLGIPGTSVAVSTVKVGDNYFVKPSGTPSVTASKGQRITFKFVGRVSHNVVVTKGPVEFRSPIQSSGSYRSPKLKAGTYTIICELHGASDQRMKLRVK